MGIAIERSAALAKVCALRGLAAEIGRDFDSLQRDDDADGVAFFATLDRIEVMVDVAIHELVALEQAGVLAWLERTLTPTPVLP